MSSWLKTVEKAVAGEATKEEFIHAVTGWLTTELAEYTEGSYEAISRRVIWLFDEKWAIVYGSYFPLTVTHMDEEVTSETTPPIELPGWSYRKHANGWQHHLENSDISEKDILHLIDALSKILGEPKLVLPWGYCWADNIAEEELDEYLEWGAEGSEELRTAMHALATSVGEPGSLAEVSPWELEKTDEAEWMPEFCDWSRFQRVTSAIEERKLMILNLDEHCAACGSNVYEWAVKDDPEMEGKRIFLTWGQNSQGTYLGDGSIYLEVYLDDEGDERAVKQIAADEGLDDQINEEDWEPSGAWYYES